VPAAAGSKIPRRVAITVADLGEFGLIAAIAALLPASSAGGVGIGDDAAVVGAPDGRVVATTDLLVEGRHFRRDWSGASDIGVKAAAQNLADVAAMGASPTALLLGFAAPGDLLVTWVEDLVRGLAEECERAGASVVGGDVSGADSVMLAITALGDLGGRDPVTRSGARPGDRLAVAGGPGRSAAGLALLEAGLAGAPGVPGAVGQSVTPAPGVPGAVGQSVAPAPGVPGAVGQSVAPAPGVPRVTGPAGEFAGLVASHRRPQPPYACGPEAAALGATSMIDISDGLVADLGHVAEASGVRLDVETARLPADPELRAAAAALGADWLRWALAGGEDHALAATFPPETNLPGHWVVIGTVGQGHGVTVDSRPADALRGWDHFA
jgi:thiamine-monophosphate kinase